VQRSHRDTLISGALSLVLHALLLLAAATAMLRDASPVELILIALRPGGGHDGPGSGGEPRAATPRDVAAQPAALPRAAPAPIPKPQRPSPPQVARQRAPRILPAPEPIAASPATGGPEVAVAAEPVAAAGAGDGAGGGHGSGAGSGDGTGRGGAGIGDGSDSRPYCDYCPEPTYPLIARRRGWKGTVDVGLVLLADGRVDSATLRHSSGYEVLDREAIDVARRSRFRFPARAPAAPVFGRIEYRFELLPAP